MIEISQNVDAGEGCRRDGGEGGGAGDSGGGGMGDGASSGAGDEGAWSGWRRIGILGSH